MRVLLCLSSLMALSSRVAAADNPDGSVIPAPFVPADDIVFIDAMNAHHRAAIEMADEEIARGADPEVIAMARSIREVQLAEIDVIIAVRAALTDDPVTPSEDDPHRDADLARLAALSGHGLDEAFLEEMIPHHGGALELVHRALAVLANEELRRMATDIVAMQAREIGEMQVMLDGMTTPMPD